MDVPPSHHGVGASGSNSSNTSGNSGSQYALCAMGVGLIALGIVMIVWSVVPANPQMNISESGSKKNQVSSVAFILVGCGVAMLLVSMGLGMRNKQREQLRLQEAQNNQIRIVTEQEQRESGDEQAQHYAVPTYEEAVGSGQYPLRQTAMHPSASQLPSYDDLVKVDGVEYEFERPAITPAVPRSAPAPVPTAAPSAQKSAKNSRKALALKIRRIKSEKLLQQNAENSQPAAELFVEPLTPPPQYED
ncbi:transmembrane protein 51a [Thalassophryne amazonica]|uniref:transmembrane protein 51a n=1 Tax=Thalassophryne amazonica TaxID=390379 RepID=UPI0014717BC6|nr:transmembrane protein 51a [Thalassophryne amazonica]XP_034029087.1 transmembrane protein 51a [Thalassophryne amazonica]